MKFIGWPVLFTTAIDCNHIIPQFWLHHKQNSLFSGKVSEFRKCSQIVIHEECLLSKLYLDISLARITEWLIQKFVVQSKWYNVVTVNS